MSARKKKIIDKIPDQRTCLSKVCRKKFTPFRDTQTVCDYVCANNYQAQLREKKAKEEQQGWKKRKAETEERLKTWMDYFQEALNLFNEFIRLRDKDKDCISCGAKAGTYRISSGHFHPQGTYKSTALNEDNAHGQCWFNCNKNKHGNLSEYRPRLIERIGIDRVNEIDRLKNETIKRTIPELQQLKAHYRRKINELKKL
jgi:hypothetical protein